MGWIAAIIAIVLMALLMPRAIVAAKKSARGKGRMGGAALMIGLAFATVFDPAQAAAIEEMQKKKEAGDTEEDASGELLD